MNKAKYYSQFVFYFAVEMFVPVFIGILINIHNTSTHSSHVLPLTAVLLVLLVLSHFIVRRWRLSYIYILVPLGIILLLISGSYWLTVLLITGFAVWTLEQLHDNINNHYNDKMLVIMLVLLLIINLINSPVIQEHHQLIHLTAIGMFVFYFLGRIIMLMAGIGYRLGSKIFVFILSSLLLLGAAALFTGLYKYAVFGIQSVFIFLLNGFILLLRPFFSFLETVEFKFPEMEQDQMEVNESGDAVEESFEGTAALSNVPVMTILLTLLAIGITIFLIMYFKKRSSPKKESFKPAAYKTFVTDGNIEDLKKNGEVPPDSKVRKQYYAFEKWLAKRDVGRYHGETINEWVKRAGLTDEIDQELLERYKKYRYDSRELTAAEFDEFKEMLRDFKRKIESR